jgi:hypothetical protein
MVVNARDAKHVPGRTTDVSDAQWIQRLHAYGLLRAKIIDRPGPLRYPSPVACPCETVAFWWVICRSPQSSDNRLGQNQASGGVVGPGIGSVGVGTSVGGISSPGPGSSGGKGCDSMAINIFLPIIQQHKTLINDNRFPARRRRSETQAVWHRLGACGRLQLIGSWSVSQER